MPRNRKRTSSNPSISSRRKGKYRKYSTDPEKEGMDEIDAQCDGDFEYNQLKTSFNLFAEDEDIVYHNSKVNCDVTSTSEMSYRHMRQVIGFLYTNILCFPAKEDWKNAASTVCQMVNFKKDQRRRIYHIFNLCEEARERGERYEGARQSKMILSNRAFGTEGVQVQIMGDVLEHGGGFRITADILNRWRSRNGLDPIAHSTVKNHVDNFLKTRKQRIEKVKSGSSNPYSPWCRASYRWNKQLAIRYRMLDPYTCVDPPMPPPPPGTKPKWIEQYNLEEESDRLRLESLKEACMRDSNKDVLTVLLPEYDIDKLSPISLYQHADWDETHPKTQIGCITNGGKKEEVIFLGIPMGESLLMTMVVSVMSGRRE